jgi:Holliday junction resolvase RusA-like endonuclease
MVLALKHGTFIPSMTDPPFGAAPNPRGEPVTISLSGEPQGKGRARSFVRGGHVGHYTPSKTRSYESLISGLAMDAMIGRLPFDCAVELIMRAVFSVPPSFSKRKQNDAMVGALWPAKKPDYDNILKAWSDAMNGVVYRDDALIVRVQFEKRYGPQPLVAVTVRAA